MTVKVKICGVRTAQALDTALDAGTDYFGLVFYPRSPRNVALNAARELAERGRGRALSVALLVDADDDAIAAVADVVNPDLIQLHGSESPDRVAAIKAATGRPVVKAIKVATSHDVTSAARYAGCADIILYDAKASAGDPDALPGGNGVAFDWRALTGLEGNNGFMLSGGLTPENVHTAILRTGAAYVDVSSGVETAPGEKDPELIRRFIAAAKGQARESGKHHG